MAKDTNTEDDQVVYGACHYLDATGRIVCEDGLTAEECGALNGTFYPNQQCPDA